MESGDGFDNAWGVTSALVLALLVIILVIAVLVWSLRLRPTTLRLSIRLLRLVVLELESDSGIAQMPPGARVADDSSPTDL
jgi:hypothetical protein